MGISPPTVVENICSVLKKRNGAVVLVSGAMRTPSAPAKPGIRRSKKVIAAARPSAISDGKSSHKLAGVTPFGKEVLGSSPKDPLQVSTAVQALSHPELVGLDLNRNLRNPLSAGC